MHCMSCSLLILVVLGMFFFGGDAQGDAVLASVDRRNVATGSYRRSLIYLMYSSVCFVAIIATVVGVFVLQFGSCTERQSGSSVEIFD